MTNFKWRSAVANDAAAIVALFAAERVHEPRVTVPTQSSIEQTMSRILDRPNGDMVVIHDDAGMLIGMTLYMLIPSDGEILAQCRGHVHVDYRRQGLGNELLAWSRAQAIKQHQALAPEKLLRMVTACQGFNQDSVALFEKSGFKLGHSSVQMRRGLNLELTPRQLPSGLRTELWSDGQDELLRETFNLAFVDNWGVPQFEREDWRQRFIETTQFRPDLSYLVFAGEQLVAFCLSEHYVERNEERGINEAWMEAIGVHPDWRGQGIAKAIMVYAMGVYKELGFTHAGLDVDGANPTNAMAVYEQLGFEEIRRELLYSRQLADAVLVPPLE